MSADNGLGTQLIPSFVGQYRRKKEEKTPQMIIIDSESNQSKAEKSLCNFFKCTKNWPQMADIDGSTTGGQQSSGLNNRCFATRHTSVNFGVHLIEKHKTDQLFCFYCNQIQDNKTVPKFYSHRYLIKHMLKRHRFRRFQCNRCEYRAITDDHLILHQMSKHETDYMNAIKGISDGNVCKMFLCQTDGTDNVFPKLDYFYTKRRFERFNSQGLNETLYQCLYCDFMAEPLDSVVDHCVQRHPDYPILYYIPEPQISSSSCVLVNDFITYDNIAIVRPKLEPQDNSVSSTQKSFEADIPAANEVNTTAVKRTLNLEDNDREINVQNEAKRSRICDTNSSEPIDMSTDETKNICLFCDQIFTNYESAKKHLVSHFNLSEMTGINRQFVVNWIQQFLLKQLHLCSFEELNKSDQKSGYYCCPLCLKLADIYKRVAKRYKRYSEVRNHLYQHIGWMPLRCKVKSCFTFLPNCDTIFTKHLLDNHSLITKTKKFKFLYSNESEMCFTTEQRLEIEKKFVYNNYKNSVIEDAINGLIIKIKSDSEHRLRVMHKCNQKTVSTSLSRLPSQEFAKYYKEFVEYEHKKRTEVVDLVVSDADEDVVNNTTKNTKNRKEKNKKSNKEKKHRKRGHKKDSTLNVMDLDERWKRTDKSIESLEQQINSISNTMSGETAGTSGTSGLSHRTNDRVTGSPGMQRNKDSEDSLIEENYRYSCYNCNDKFMSRKDFNEHHKAVHPYRTKRYYKKDSKPSD